MRILLFENSMDVVLYIVKGIVLCLVLSIYLFVNGLKFVIVWTKIIFQKISTKKKQTANKGITIAITGKVRLRLITL